MADAADPLSLDREASRDLLLEVKPGAEPPTVRSLLREAARDLLGIQAEADDDAVRRRCLEVLEAEQFYPGDDLGTAIRMLCAEPPPDYRRTEAGPQYRRCVDRLVRRELETVAVRLRTEPGKSVKEDLARLDPLAALSRSGREWHARLIALGEADLPLHLKSGEQLEIVRAIRAVETTWPGEAAAVRREQLARLTPRDRYLRAARALVKRHPSITSFDQPLLEAMQLVTPPGTTGYPHKPPLSNNERLFRIVMVAFGMTLAIALVWPEGEPDPRLVRSTASPFSPAASPPPPARSGASASARARRPVTDFPELPKRTRPALPGGFEDYGPAVYAPRRLPDNLKLIPGEVVKINGFQDDSLWIDGRRQGERLLVPVEDLLSEETAKRELQARVSQNPGDAVAHLTLGNVLLQAGYPRTAEPSFTAARLLGLPSARQSLRFNLVLYVPLPAEDAPEVPPPPPLPRLFPGAAP